MFSTDVLIAAGVFVFILVAMVWIFDISAAQRSQQQQYFPMHQKARRASSVLIQTPGSPNNWHHDFDSADSVGLADSFGILNYDKVMKLYELNSSYQELKKYLGITEDYYILLDSPGWVLGGFLGTKIAYTYADGDPEEGDENHSGIRDYLDKNSIPYTDYEDDWESLIENIENYDTIIMEDPQLRESDLTQEQRDRLETWVVEGNTFFQKQYGRIIELFNVTTNNVAHENGDVIALNSMLDNVEIGDHVMVEQGYRISKQSDIHKLVEHDPSNHVLIGWWDHGNGKVYYMPDTEGEILDENGTFKYNNTQVTLKLPQLKKSLVIGKLPQNATTVVLDHRIALYENNTVNITVGVWK